MAIFGFDTAVTHLGHFGGGRHNQFDVPDVIPCTLEEICEKLDNLQITVNNNAINITNNGGALTEILTCCQELLSRIKLVESDVDRMKKRSKYWEDRNLLQQTTDEKAGRSNFRQRRQDLGGKE